MSESRVRVGSRAAGELGGGGASGSESAAAAEPALLRSISRHLDPRLEPGEPSLRPRCYLLESVDSLALVLLGDPHPLDGLTQLCKVLGLDLGMVDCKLAQVIVNVFPHTLQRECGILSGERRSETENTRQFLAYTTP